MKDKATTIKVTIPEKDHIRKCDCSNNFQDTRYGKGKRVHTPLRKKMPTASQEWRCTVCGITRY
jgi:hypothetical protein